MTNKNLLNASVQVLTEAIAENTDVVTVNVPFQLNVKGSESVEDAQVENRAQKDAQKILRIQGFKYISDEIDYSAEVLYVVFSGLRKKVAAFIKKWMRESGSDDKIIQLYSEETETSVTENASGFSRHAPVSKTRRISAVVNSIPDSMIPYVIDVMVTGLTNKEIDEVIAKFKSM